MGVRANPGVGYIKDEKVDVEQHINEMSHIYNALIKILIEDAVFKSVCSCSHKVLAVHYS